MQNRIEIGIEEGGARIGSGASNPGARRVDGNPPCGLGGSGRFSFVGGFTLVELMLSVSIMTVIIFALYQMFNQTQKALRSNITQVDVLESGRVAADLLARQIQQLAASGVAQGTNILVRPVGTPSLVLMDTDGKTPLMTNTVDDVFFVNTLTNDWVGNGYLVRGIELGVGTLYRAMSATSYHGVAHRRASSFSWTGLENFPVTNFALVADGIVHFRLLAYDPDGRLMSYASTNLHPSYRIRRSDLQGRRLSASSDGVNAPASVYLNQAPGGETSFVFLSNALPAYIDLELGVLEPQTLHEFYGLKEAPAKVQREFLSKQAGHVHMFRKRIPIRTSVQ